MNSKREQRKWKIIFFLLFFCVCVFFFLFDHLLFLYSSCSSTPFSKPFSLSLQFLSLFSPYSLSPHSLPPSFPRSLQNRIWCQIPLSKSVKRGSNAISSRLLAGILFNGLFASVSFTYTLCLFTKDGNVLSSLRNVFNLSILSSF